MCAGTLTRCFAPISRGVSGTARFSCRAAVAAASDGGAAEAASAASGRGEAGYESCPHSETTGVRMRSYNDCVPCMFRQALHSAQMAFQDEGVRGQIMRKVARAIRGMDMRLPPPVMGQRIHRIIREMAGNADPYREIKDRLNQAALELYPALKARVTGSARPMEAAVRLAIAGNIMDCGVNSELAVADVLPAVELAFTEPLVGDPEEFAEAALAAKRILYLADNAGEIVFDRLLIELLPLEKVTVAVRGAPVINDATLEDAEKAGLLDLVEVIDNGSDAPGTILDDCNEEFRERFDAADLVIAKGQGNYETLSDVEKNIFFLLKVKCPVIAQDIGYEVGAMVLRRATAAASVEKKGEPIAWV